MIVSTSVISEIPTQSWMAQLKLSRAVLPIAVPMPMLIQTQQPLPPFNLCSSADLPRLKLQFVEQRLRSHPGWNSPAAHVVRATHRAQPFAITAVIDAPPWSSLVDRVVRTSSQDQPFAITVGPALHRLCLRQRRGKRSRKDSSQAGASGPVAFHRTQLLGRLHSDLCLE